MRVLESEAQLHDFGSLSALNDNDSQFSRLEALGKLVIEETREKGLAKKSL
jgi:hypothetical protein